MSGNQKRKRTTKKQLPKVVPDNLPSKNHPPSEDALPIPDIDKETVKEVNKLVETSFLQYMADLKTKNHKEAHANMVHLNNILSEYLGTFILVGYMPNDEPVELFNTPTPRDKEAVIERLRKTFIRHYI